MLMPSVFSENLFDDLFDFDFDFPALRDTEKQLYGKKASRVMRTDVHEHDDHFELDIDLPGFKKDEVTLELKDGYLTVQAAKGLDKDTNDDKGKVIRQERYAGSMSRSFFVGKEVKEEDVKAKMEHGVLHVALPKKEQPKVEQRKTIMIEG